MIKLAILDFDDTLVENINMDFESFQYPCKELGMNSLKFDQIVSFRKNGMNAKEIIREIFRENNEPTSDKFFKIREDFLTNPENFKFFKLKDNFKKFFQYIDEHKIKLVLTTSRSNKNEIISFLKKNNIFRFFSEIITKEDIMVSTDNRNYLDRLLIKNLLIKKILRTIMVDPSNIVYIGNAIEDSITAKNMKVDFIGIQNYYLEDNDFLNSPKVHTVEMLINEFDKLNRK